MTVKDVRFDDARARLLREIEVLADAAMVAEHVEPRPGRDDGAVATAA